MIGRYPSVRLFSIVFVKFLGKRYRKLRQSACTVHFKSEPALTKRIRHNIKNKFFEFEKWEMKYECLLLHNFLGESENYTYIDDLGTPGP